MKRQKRIKKKLKTRNYTQERERDKNDVHPTVCRSGPRAESEPIDQTTNKKTRAELVCACSFFISFIFFCWSRKFLQQGNNFIFSFFFFIFSPQKIPLDTKSGGAGPSTGCPCGWHDVSRPCSRIGPFPPPLQRTAPTGWNQVPSRHILLLLLLRLLFSLRAILAKNNEIKISVSLWHCQCHTDWLAYGILRNQLVFLSVFLTVVCLRNTIKLRPSLFWDDERGLAPIYCTLSYNSLFLR